MENASKALIIAGGVFLALMILSLLVYVLSSMTDFADAQDRAKQVSEIEEFNKSYQAYNKQRMYGIDIISVVNKANDNNIKNKDNDEYKVTVKILDKSGKEISLDESDEFKRTIFRCDSMDDSNNNGRIDTITFIQIK